MVYNSNFYVSRILKFTRPRRERGVLDTLRAPASIVCIFPFIVMDGGSFSAFIYVLEENKWKSILCELNEHLVRPFMLFIFTFLGNAGTNGIRMGVRVRLSR